MIPVLVRHGHTMTAHAGHTTVFERRPSLVGPLLASVFLFPFGLIALLGRGRETVTVVGGGSVQLYGCCSKPVADFLIAAADEIAAERDFAH